MALRQINRDVSVAYLILAHSDPDHFGRLLRRLAHPRAGFVVHVDVKSDRGPFERAAENIANVTFVENRVRVMWAGFSQVQSTLHTIEAASVATTRACTHFVILSGGDYPLVANDVILDHFAASQHRQFIRRWDILNCGDAHQQWRLRGYHFRELADRFTWKRRPLFAIERTLRAFPRRYPSDLTFAAGSNWVALTRDCALHCADVARSNPAFMALFRNTFASDEIVFHTLVQNSPFVDEAEPLEPYVDVTGPGGPWHYDNLHYLNPIEPIRSAEEAVRILAERKPNQLFARKFGTATSGAALAVIDASIDGTGHATAIEDHVAA